MDLKSLKNGDDTVQNRGLSLQQQAFHHRKGKGPPDVGRVTFRCRETHGSWNSGSLSTWSTVISRARAAVVVLWVK